jgi:hypothetical protein
MVYSGLQVDKNGNLTLIFGFATANRRASLYL